MGDGHKITCTLYGAINKKAFPFHKYNYDSKSQIMAA